MKRIFDFGMACMALTLFCIPMLVFVVLIRMTSPGPALYWSERVGREPDVQDAEVSFYEG